MRRGVLIAVAALLAVALLAPRGASATQAADQAEALAKVLAQCSALILPPATTPEQVRQNELAKEAFLKLSAEAEPEVKVCSVAEVPDNEEFPAEDKESLSGQAKVKTCGNCPTCFSAAACNGCAVGSVCSPPGAVPTRACRSVGVTCGFFTTTYCCGCS